jgi:hypothetical protein
MERDAILGLLWACHFCSSSLSETIIIIIASLYVIICSPPRFVCEFLFHELHAHGIECNQRLKRISAYLNLGFVVTSRRNGGVEDEED